MDARDVVVVEANPNIAPFRPGDTVRVNIRIREGERQRLQALQGVVIRRTAGGPASRFTVRQIASNVGVERSFLLHSPNVERVEVVRRGKVRRAKLYYLRGLTGRAARIKEAPRVSKGSSAVRQKNVE